MRNKDSLRTFLSKERQKFIASGANIHANKVICEKLLGIINQNNYLNIACYYPTKYEVDITQLFQDLWKMGKKLFLPKIQASIKELDFCNFASNTIMAKNKFNIYEPQASTVIAKNSLDMVILPLLGFDKAMNRLGTGAGFYDYTFSYKKNTDRNKLKPILIGAAYSKQLVDKIDIDPWDVEMDSVVTEIDFDTL